MHKNKGQALVEFIIVMPVLMFIVVGVIDFGNILYQKYQLENVLDTVTDMYKQDKLTEINEYLADKDITVNYNILNKMETIALTKKINIYTPGLNLILENPYAIKVERVIYNEK